MIKKKLFATDIFLNRDCNKFKKFLPIPGKHTKAAAVIRKGKKNWGKL